METVRVQKPHNHSYDDETEELLELNGKIRGFGSVSAYIRVLAREDNERILKQ